MHIKMAISWLIIAILAGLMNYACTAVNFSSVSYTHLTLPTKAQV